MFDNIFSYKMTNLLALIINLNFSGFLLSQNNSYNFSMASKTELDEKPQNDLCFDQLVLDYVIGHLTNN